MKTWFSWSNGKDSAYALHILLKEKIYDVEAIFTTITDNFERVSMHSVREELLEKQAKNLSLPLHKIRIPYPCTNKIYKDKMQDFLKKAKSEKVEAIAFGDLHLESVREYKIKMLERTGILPLFPLWGRSTDQVSQKIVNGGFKAIITCVDESKLDSDFSGRKYDQSFLSELPKEVDPCGENGEFHSFVYSAPIFFNDISIDVGKKITREGFTFTDLVAN